MPPPSRAACPGARHPQGAGPLPTAAAERCRDARWSEPVPSRRALSCSRPSRTIGHRLRTRASQRDQGGAEQQPRREILRVITARTTQAVVDAIVGAAAACSAAGRRDAMPRGDMIEPSPSGDVRPRGDNPLPPGRWTRSAPGLHPRLSPIMVPDTAEATREFPRMPQLSARRYASCCAGRAARRPGDRCCLLRRGGAFRRRDRTARLRRPGRDRDRERAPFN